MYYNRSHGNNSTSSRSTSKAAPYEPNLFDDEELDGSIWDSSIEANENFDIFPPFSSHSSSPVRPLWNKNIKPSRRN